ncbi:hypothetical protein BLNAU_17192 [Blattamonas nauphoetae]|uniref:B30.2/SPRY domain-containing protein n=1 Tax=Blattamonas nauphoetae TaxID=2049346 RepID=A0ABQ9X9F0_9EUKA|nr:hypothetical protein BLNAU_17192 [Blattamonas nauphoetae]
MASTPQYSNAPDAYTDISQLLQLDQMDESEQSGSLFSLSSLVMDSPTNAQHFINLNGFFIVCNVITMASDSSVQDHGLQIIQNVVGGIEDNIIPEDPENPVQTLFMIFCTSKTQTSEYLKAWFQIQIENDRAFPSYFLTNETLGYALSCLSPQFHLGWKIKQITDLLILSTANHDVHVQYSLDLAWEDIRTMETQMLEEERADEAEREASRKAREKKKMWIAEMRKAGVGAEYDQTHPLDELEEIKQADQPTSHQSSSGQEVATNEVGVNGVELEELRGRLENQEREIFELTQSNTGLLTQTASLKEKLEKEEAKRAEHEANVTNLLGEVEELKNAKESAEKDMARLQRYSAEKEEAENALREELAGLQGMLEEEKKRNDELEQKVTNLDELQSKLAESEKKVNQLSEQIEAGETGRSAEHEVLKKEVNKLNALLQDKEQEKINLSGELKAAKESYDESIAKYSEEIRNLDNELGTVKNENTRLATSLKSATDGNDAGQALNAALEQANADLDQERRKRSETESELEKLKKSYAELETRTVAREAPNEFEDGNDEESEKDKADGETENDEKEEVSDIEVDMKDEDDQPDDIQSPDPADQDVGEKDDAMEGKSEVSDNDGEGEEEEEEEEENEEEEEQVEAKKMTEEDRVRKEEEERLKKEEERRQKEAEERRLKEEAENLAKAKRKLEQAKMTAPKSVQETTAKWEGTESLQTFDIAAHELTQTTLKQIIVPPKDKPWRTAFTLQFEKGVWELKIKIIQENANVRLGFHRFPLPKDAKERTCGSYWGGNGGDFNLGAGKMWRSGKQILSKGTNKRCDHVGQTAAIRVDISTRKARLFVDEEEQPEIFTDIPSPLYLAISTHDQDQSVEVLWLKRLK